jgi:hypothetical protein
LTSISSSASYPPRIHGSVAIARKLIWILHACRVAIGQRGLNTAVRTAVLGDHRPGLTVVICTLFEPDWVAEIEAIAFRDPL